MNRSGLYLSVFVLVCSLLAVGCTANSPTNVANSSPSAPSNTLSLSRDGVDAAEPAVAASNGNAFAAYVEKDANGGGDLYVRQYDAKANLLGEAARVNPVQGQVRTWHGDPPTLAFGPNGELYLGWTAKYPDGGKGTLLYLSVSRDNAATFAEPIAVNDDKVPASHGMHSIAVAADGSIYMAWLDERYLQKSRAATSGGMPMLAFFHHTPTPAPEKEPDAELYFSVSKDGGKTFSENKRIDGNVCPCCKTTLAIGSDGKLAVGYRKVYEGGFRHITVMTTANGEFGKPVQVSDDHWQIDACPVSGPALRFVGDKLSVAWYSGGEAREHGIYATSSTDGSINSFTSGVLVDAFEGGGSPVWSGDSIIWSNDGMLKIRNASGTTKDLGEGRNAVAAVNGGNAIFALTSNVNERKSVMLGTYPAF